MNNAFNQSSLSHENLIHVLSRCHDSIMRVYETQNIVDELFCVAVLAKDTEELVKLDAEKQKMKTQQDVVEWVKEGCEAISESLFEQFGECMGDANLSININMATQYLKSATEMLAKEEYTQVIIYLLRVEERLKSLQLSMRGNARSLFISGNYVKAICEYRCRMEGVSKLRITA